MGIHKYDRAQAPAHYELTLENFSLLDNSKLEFYDSEPFKAGNYQWRLRIYPKGDTRKLGKDHISLYLVIDDDGKLPKNFQVMAHFKLFCLNQNTGNYMVHEEEDMGQSRFHAGTRAHGYPQFLLRTTFLDDANGYLVQDKCIFGAEVFVFDLAPRREMFRLVRQQRPEGYLEWRINYDDARAMDFVYSTEELTTVQKDKWKLLIYINGDYQGNPDHVSFFLELVGGDNVISKRRVYADFTLRVRSQHRGAKHFEKRYSKWFTSTDKKGGESKFMETSDLQGPNGYLMMVRNQNILIVEVEIHMTSELFIDVN